MGAVTNNVHEETMYRQTESLFSYCRDMRSMAASVGSNFAAQDLHRTLQPSMSACSDKALPSSAWLADFKTSTGDTAGGSEMLLRLCAPLAAVLLFFSQNGVAQAEGFALYEYSARGIALGGSMMARKPDASVVAYNPAQITRLEGGHVMAGVSSISPKGKMRWTDGDGNKGSSKLKDLHWFIPHAYYTQQLSDDWFFGIGEFTRFGLGFEYPHEWPGNENIYEVALTTFSINPNIAWKATDQLSLAAGVEIMYGSLDLKKRAAPLRDDYGLDNQMDINMRDMEDVGYGFNLAAHYQFSDQWAVGLQYRSPIKAKLEGDVEFSNVNIPSMFYQGIAARGYRDGSTSTKVTLPDSVAGGIAWTPVPEFSIEAGAVWTRWSTFDKLDFSMPHGLDKAKNPKDWKDVWRFNVGAEWQALDWLTLRAGYVFDESPMTSKYEDYLVPTADRHIFSGGFGVQWQDWTVDFAYAYIYPRGRHYNANGGTHTLDSQSDASSTRIFSLSVGYEF